VSGSLIYISSDLYLTFDKSKYCYH